jgi:hypothetical protein
MLTGKEITREVILSYLSQGVCRVYFRKATNGRFRSLYCTLSPATLPKEYEKYLNEIFSFQNRILDLIPVYDIIDKEWKSFYIQNVLHFYTSDDLTQSKVELEKVKEIKKQ